MLTLLLMLSNGAAVAPVLPRFSLQKSANLYAGVNNAALSAVVPTYRHYRADAQQGRATTGSVQTTQPQQQSGGMTQYAREKNVRRVVCR
jgi:hypothetical protein